jgi:hypothetical protein
MVLPGTTTGAAKRRARYGFVSLVAATLACAVEASCAGSAPGGGGGAPVDAGGEEDASSPDEEDAPVEGKDAPDEPWGEAGWTDVPWGAPCIVEVARKPEAAVPYLIWHACVGGEAGCEQAPLHWNHSQGQPFRSMSVIPWGDGYRVGTVLHYEKGEQRAAIYDETGKPLVAWRTDDDLCVITTPVLTPERAWLGAVHFEDLGGESAFIVGPVETLATTTKTANVHVIFQGVAAGDQALGLWGVTGYNMFIYDRLTDSVTNFAPQGSYLGFDQPHPVNDGALVQYYPQFNQAEAWYWHHETNALTPLLQPGDSVSVADVQSDGKTLAWVHGGLPLTPDYFYPWAELWTSPFASDKADLAPKKIRTLPTQGSVVAHLNGDRYAIYSYLEKLVYVIRLSDGWQWTFHPPDESYEFYEIFYLDDEYVWYFTFGNVYRQSMSALGPGDPPP